jgi:FMN phosphatase YigB (HAD superfamily)
MKLNPDEAVFVDDNPGYVKRASGEGLKIILFTNADDFAKEMKKCGISLGTK